MIHGMKSAPHRYIPQLLIVGALVAAMSSAAWADPVAPKPNDRQIAFSVAFEVQRKHVSGHPLDAEISERCLKMFLKALDPMKVYFYQSDIDEFNKHKDELAESIRKGDVRFAYTVFLTYLQRIDERMKMVDEILDGPLDFTRDEEMMIDPEVAQYPQHAGRGPGPLAEADQVRPAGAEGRQEGGQGGEGGPRQAPPPLPQLRQADAPDQQRGVVGDVPERVHHVVRSAHRLHVAAHAGEFRHCHESGVGRDRGFADERRRRLHGDQENHPRRRRRQGRPAEGRGQDRRRSVKARAGKSSTWST